MRTRGTRASGAPGASACARGLRALAPVFAVVAIALGAADLAPGALGASPARPVNVLATPLATSISTTSGTWASIPMGHLGQALNTFWQLFTLPDRPGARWTDRAASLAVATNGGLVLATPGGDSLVVGIRPSNLLDFSPLATTPNGTAWSPVPPVPALDSRPDALAATSGGAELALSTNGGRSPEVQSLAANRSTWHTLVTESSLAASGAGRPCGVGSLTAVAYGTGGAPLVGAACEQPGVVGVFAEGPGGWRLAGPTLPATWSTFRVEVVRLQRAGTGVSALLALSGGSSTDLVAAWSGTNARWSVSPALGLARAEHLVSVGQAAGVGEFALLADGSGHDRAAVATGPDTPWQTLSPPPASTATLAFGPKGRVDALAVDNTVLSDWTLRPTGGWTRSEVIHVPIQFGSSG